MYFFKMIRLSCASVKLQKCCAGFQISDCISDYKLTFPVFSQILVEWILAGNFQKVTLPSLSSSGNIPSFMQ